MKRRKGSAAAESPSSSPIRPSIRGARPARRLSSSTGCMTKRVRNSARPTTTGLGGTPWAPIAVRSSGSTMTMRAKAVAITSSDGASARSPMSAVSCTRREVAPGAPAVPRSTLTLCAKAVPPP